MKKQLLILFFILLNYITNRAFAQDSIKTKLSKWDISVQINTPERKSPLEEQTENSFSSAWSDDLNLYHGRNNNAITKDKTFAASLIARYNIKDDVLFRFKAGINKVNISLLEDKTDTDGIYHDEAYKKRNDFIFSMGIGRGITYKQFTLYTGFEIPFTYYGKGDVYYFTKTQYPTSADYATYEFKGTIFTSSSIGIGHFSSFSFQRNKFSIGGEISFSFLYNKRLGPTTFFTENKDYINGVFTSSDITYNTTVSNFDMSKIKPSIYFTYNF